MNRIITISRQFGSGGRTIGRMVAERLNIPCYDSEIIDKVAEESGFAKDYIEKHGEYSEYKSWLGKALEHAGNGGNLSNQDRLWIAQRKVVCDLADAGPCVIVGRCADSILKGREGVVNVFIHADKAARAERIVKVYGETDIPVQKRIADKDKRRSTYYKYYTDTKWGVAENYHVALDSGKLGLDKCVDIIVDLF